MTDYSALRRIRHRLKHLDAHDVKISQGRNENVFLSCILQKDQIRLALTEWNIFAEFYNQTGLGKQVALPCPTGGGRCGRRVAAGHDGASAP